MIPLAILSNLNSIELSIICPNQNTDCTIGATYKNQTIENNNNLIFTKIAIETPLNRFINNASLTITGTGEDNTIHLKKDYTIIQGFINNGTISGNYIYLHNHSYTGVKNFYNYGDIHSISASLQTNIWDGGEGYGFVNIYNYGYMSGGMNVARSGDSGTTHLYNYGEMGGVWTENTSAKTAIVDNLGVINFGTKTMQYHFDVRVVLVNYAMQITENASVFNSFSGNATFGNNSHLIIGSGGSVSFADNESRLLLDFGGDFDFGAEYALNKLVVDTNGANKLQVDFDRLTTRSDIYYITQQGDKFIVHFAPQYSAIGNLYKANVRTMNKFLTMSNSMIYPRKHNSVILRKQSDRRNSKNIFNNNLVILSEAKYLKNNRDSSLISFTQNDDLEGLAQNDTFFHQNKSQNLQTRRIKRPNKRNYSRNVKDSQNLNTDSANRTRERQNQRKSQNLNNSAESKPYYFILTPFVNHNNFAKSGNYNLSGFDYGFLTAFSGKIAESNSLGAHFAFSYGNLNDSHDKDLSIHTMNFMLGLNYKLDLVYDMFFKARSDVFYFANALDSATLKNIKPNNLGFGLSVSYGKDFDFKQGGILGIEGGIDYKALNASEITLNSMSETYKKSLYHLLYADLGISYAKYFANFGINANLGIKGNITANKLAKSQIRLNNFNRSIDMILDNDKVLGYANMGLSYVLSARNFDMEFSLAYYGNFGDRMISNGGGVEWRVGW